MIWQRTKGHFILTIPRVEEFVQQVFDPEWFCHDACHSACDEPYLLMPAEESDQNDHG